MRKKHLILALVSMVCLVGWWSPPAHAAEEGGSIGVEGRIGAAPPTVGASISFPSNGQVFTSIPITVTGICSGDVLVKVFKNNVFGGSAQCTNGNFQITIDLFSGRNELIARVYDALDQAGPDSNTVVVTFNDSRGGTVNRPTLTSNFAKRGADPNKTLTWPIILSGGVGPYAVSVDWGDGKPADLFTLNFAGTFDISHVYERPGSYNLVVRVSDSNDNVAFLQLVAIANGSSTQADEEDVTSNTIIIYRLLWWPLLLVIPLLVLAFWLGSRYRVRSLRRQLEREQRLM